MNFDTPNVLKFVPELLREEYVLVYVGLLDLVVKNHDSPLLLDLI